jgi:hypothetical protein
MKGIAIFFFCSKSFHNTQGLREGKADPAGGTWYRAKVIIVGEEAARKSEGEWLSARAAYLATTGAGRGVTECKHVASLLCMHVCLLVTAKDLRGRRHKTSAKKEETS